MIRKLLYISVIAAGTFVSCSLDNDIHHPDTPADFTAFEVDGQNSTKIDTKARTISVELSEDADIKNLTIRTLRYTEGARCSDPGMKAGKKIDLSTPLQVTLSLFEDYVWTISATQPVERYVKCEGQVGDAIIHEDTRTVNVTVKTDKTSAIDSRTSLVITGMKLGVKGSEVISTKGWSKNDRGTYSESTQEINSFPVTLDCFFERIFTVRKPDGSTEDWKMIVLPE